MVSFLGRRGGRSESQLMIASVVSIPIGNWPLRLVPLIAALLAGWMAGTAQGQTMPGFYRAFGNTGVARVKSTTEPDDSFDLPASYVDSAQFADDASLHAVSVSPDGRHLIAVGDWGVIVRSEDAGKTWRNVNSGIEAMLCDVRFLNESRVVAVGGGYEPVTGLSRGVAVVSDDAGRSWHRSNAIDATKLYRIAIRNGFDAEPLPAGVIEAIGDDAESSGVNRFVSMDGGLTWQPDAAQSAKSKMAMKDWRRQDVLVQDSAEPKQTKGREQTDGSSDASGQTWRVRVGTHGTIERSEDDGATWYAVRGSDRHSAVLFVAASEKSVPWSLIGRETLEAQQRAVLVLDQSETSPSGELRRLGRLRNAAMRLGVAATLLTASADWINTDEEAPAAILRTHRPAVVVLDENLPAETRDAWVRATMDDGNFGSSPFGSIRQRRRLYQSKLQSSENVASSRAVVLRSDALLSKRAVLAGDLALDAMMLVTPQLVVPASVEVSPVPGTSTELRRDSTLTGGLVLADGQRMEASKVISASRRRLQIATARMSQLGRLKELIEEPQLRSKDLTTTLGVLLPRTASEDRTRLLWWLWLHVRKQAVTVGGSQAELDRCEQVLLETMLDAVPSDPVRRWADCMLEARRESFERSVVASKQKRPQWLAFAGSASPSNASVNSSDGDSGDQGAMTDVATTEFGGGASGEVQSSGLWQAQSLSPFAVKPVTFESAMSNRGSGNTEAASADVLGNALPSLPPMTQRTNWEYHPIVMAARRISAVGDESMAVDAHEGGEALQSPRPRASKASSLPRVASRPRLDCQLQDDCWRDVAWQRTDDVAFAMVTDQEYLYVAVVHPGASAGELPRAISLWLDGDGELLSSFRFECRSDGQRHASVDGSVEWKPTWYAALSGWSQAETVDESPTETSAGPSVLAEIAIPLSEVLPRDDGLRVSNQFAVRVRAGSSLNASSGPRCLASDSQAMPDPQHWRFYGMPR